jgi:hypothetical protein
MVRGQAGQPGKIKLTAKAGGLKVVAASIETTLQANQTRR